MTTLTAEETVQWAYQFVEMHNIRDVVSIGWVSDGVCVIVCKDDMTACYWFVLDEDGGGWNLIHLNRKKAAPTFDKTQGLRARLLKEYA